VCFTGLTTDIGQNTGGLPSRQALKATPKTAPAETDRGHVPKRHVEMQVDALLLFKTVLIAT